MELIVAGLKAESASVLGVELRDPTGAPLPLFVPGAHVDVAFPNGITRQYSLVNGPSDTSVYRLGIGRSAASRGGSSYAHERLRLGDRLEVGQPRALFEVQDAAPGHLFVAGGIGVTPILSMIQWCVEHAREWRLLYCVRSRQHAAYLEELAPWADRITLHVDNENAGALADVPGVLGEMPAGWQLYCCGPAPLMDSVGAAAKAAGIPANAVHFERFSAAPAVEPAGDSGFAVRLARHGGRFSVPPGESILAVLEANGVALPFSCREGLCRSCEVPLLDGIADHRDYVLGDDERAANRSILICVSRARSPELVLDL